ncbi:hypothetical protein [Salipiger pallidus]|uniref:hypothetical protein n=1 Tax=Salipiger pallidus TaxID=1775170 RepID=UPI001668C75B|nr:hypothetical protein [Salipiger pallidus]
MSPAVILILLPDRVLAIAEDRVSSFVLIAVASVLSITAIELWRHAINRRALREAPLLTHEALDDPARDMPSARDIRRALVRTLEAEAPDGSVESGPETAEHALRRVIERIVASWGARDIAALGPGRLQELWELQSLITTRPDRAGELSQRFVNPNVVLELRDHVAEIARNRRAFDDRRAAPDAMGAPQARPNS